MRPVRLGVVGATGAVGTEVLRILEERNFPIERLVPMATARSAGRMLPFAGGEVEVVETTPAAFEGIELALFDTPDEAAELWMPVARDKGVVCVDNSAAFRLHPEIPLVVPEVNPEAAARHTGVVANPNCTMVTFVMPFAPLHRAFGARRAVVSSYQSVSGAGVAGVDDLYEQLGKLMPEREAIRTGEVSALVPPGRAFAHPIAFNVIPQVGSFDELGVTSEERRVRDETRKILDAPDLDIFATTVRVPTVHSHGISAWIEFDADVTPGDAREVLDKAAGVTLVDNPGEQEYPTALMASGKDDAYVGRVRSGGAPNTLAFFSTCDNLRKGAALNAVQIAELLVRENLL